MTEEELESQAKLDAEKSLKQENFLSPWIERFALHFRESNPDWCAYARELNRVGCSIADATCDVVLAKTQLDPVCIAYRLLLRVLCDFGAAVILAERGIVDQADMLTRSLYEAAFWMGYLQRNGDEAANAMLQDSYNSGRAALKVERKLAVSLHGEGSEFIRKIDSAISSKEKGKAQNIPDLAALSGYMEFYPRYKELSSAAAHTSLHSLHSYINDNGDGTFDGHSIGPEENRIAPVLSNACLAICLNLRSFCTIVGGTELDVQLQALLLQWDEMPKSLAPKPS